MPTLVSEGAPCSTKTCSQGEYEAGWNGFIFIPGCPAGAESVRRYLATLPDGLRKVPKGVYFLNVLHKPSGRKYAMIDNDGLFHAFLGPSGVSDSFLSLAKREQVSMNDLDPDALIEFFHFGNVFWDKTLFRSIRRIQYNDILCLYSSGKIDVLKKNIPDISFPPRLSPEEYLQDLVKSVATEYVSVDLTGGMDSRLLVVLLDALGLRFELAVSGIAGNRDIVLAQRIADLLRRELHVQYHDISDFPGIVKDSFLACDGLCNPLSSHRSLQLQQARVKRGITLSMNGQGGEFFKDHWWMQDFPLYARRKPNLNRLYSLRMFPLRQHHEYLAPHYRSLSEQFKTQFLKSLDPFLMGNSGQIYDRLFYHFKMMNYSGRSLTSMCKFVPAITPFLDRDVVAYGYSLSRLRRLFDYYHREEITRVNPVVARVPTAGPGRMTTSRRYNDFSIDIFRLAADRTKRLLRKLGQKITQKPMLEQSPNHPDLLNGARELMIKRRTLERLKDLNILDSAVRFDEITTPYYGNFLSLDMLLDQIGQ